MTTARLTSLLASLALIASLTACGGGSGSDTSASAPTGANPAPAPPASAASAPTTDVVSSAGTLQAAATSPSYAASSQQLAFFNALNTARMAAGAGAVNQSAALDAAAQAHAKYLTSNQTVTHTEDPSKVDYYEATPSSRVTKAGYLAPSFSTEVIGGTGASMSAADCALGLLNTVYHAAALLSQETDIGVGIGTDGLGVPSCVADLANPSTDTYGQVPASGKFIGYPYNGQANVPETFYVAYETPRPSATLFPNTTAGTPVIVRFRNADFINFQRANTLAVTVSKFELKDAGGNIVPAGILAATGLTGSGVTLTTDSQLGEGFAVLVPFSTLAKGATYTYTVTATLKAGGTPVTVTNTFTTNP